MHEGTIDLANALETVAMASWDLYEGTRVGRIKLGRKALVIAGSKNRSPRTSAARRR